jgi:hypothetical protein
MKAYTKIFIILTLLSITSNNLFKCDGLGLLKIECQTQDCNSQKDDNSDCYHCTTINSSLLTQAEFDFKIKPIDTYTHFFPESYQANYSFSIDRPPKA